MKHPSQYTTTPLGGMKVMQVDVGTVITDERTGMEAIVNDDTFVMKGNVMFCTQKTFEAIQAKIN